MIGKIIMIMALWTGGDQADMYVFEKPIFADREVCSDYVRENYDALNVHVNKEYGSEEQLPNLFYCIDKTEFIKLQKRLEYKI